MHIIFFCINEHFVIVITLCFHIIFITLELIKDLFPFRFVPTDTRTKTKHLNKFISIKTYQNCLDFCVLNNIAKTKFIVEIIVQVHPTHLDFMLFLLFYLFFNIYDFRKKNFICSMDIKCAAIFTPVKINIKRTNMLFIKNVERQCVVYLDRLYVILFTRYCITAITINSI